MHSRNIPLILMIAIGIVLLGINAYTLLSGTGPLVPFHGLFY